ncbi:hypothetical protein ACQRAS_05385 [Coprococcus catus]
MLFKKLLGHEIPDGKWGGELGMKQIKSGFFKNSKENKAYTAKISRK